MNVEEANFPEITLDCKASNLRSDQYKESVIELLQKVLSEDLFSQQVLLEEKIKKLKAFFNESIPIIKWSKLSDSDTTLSVTLMCRHKVHVKNYFYDIISRWLIPQRRLNIDLFFVADFKIEQVEKHQIFSIAEAVIRIDDPQDIELIKKNIRTLETEIRLGVISDYHANRILEFKGLSSDRKTAMIQEKIGSLIRTRSKDFGQGIFSDMQYFLVTCRDEYKTTRDYHHISRLISVLYVIRKLLKQRMAAQPNQRHLLVKFLKTYLQKGQNKKPLLGILVGLNFLKENEVCGKNHLLKAIRHYIPNLRAIDDSFFLDRKVKEAMQMLYLEVEKEDEKDFTYEEIKSLRENLPNYLKTHIEQLIHPIFMPRNEEEIVKNIMVLSHQIKYVHDIPQVIISFDKQSASDLSFTVIFLRVLKSTDLSLKEIFKQIPTKYKFIFERVKRAGIFRRKYIKEANVFRVFVSTKNYLRQDHSVNLNKAREDVLLEIQRLFGEVRDYNGGMIYKQNQVYKELKSSLGALGLQNELILEKFFYSITPVEMTVIRQHEPLKELFLLLLQWMNRTQQSKKKCEWVIKNDKKTVYAIGPIQDLSKKRKIVDRIEKMKFCSSEILCFYHHALDISYLGYAYFSDDEEKKNNFVSLFQKNKK